MRLAERLLLALNERFQSPHSELMAAKESPATYQTFFAARSNSSFKRFGNLDLKEGIILDLGCGLGANLDHLATSGARQVIGLDISHSQLVETQQIILQGQAAISNRICFVAADGALAPFKENTFDAIVSADTFEHVADLNGTLQECLRILKPGGCLYAYFPPFYSPWGAHMINWIHLPWCQLFFGEKTILNVARHLEATGQAINANLPEATRLSLGEGDTIPFVNHLTVKEFRNVIAGNPQWKVVVERLLPPNWRTSVWSNRFLAPINQLPYLQEVLTAKAFFVLEKIPLNRRT